MLATHYHDFPSDVTLVRAVEGGVRGTGRDGDCVVAVFVASRPRAAGVESLPLLLLLLLRLLLFVCLLALLLHSFMRQRQ